jgi:receptor protein-tyrosine kinase
MAGIILSCGFIVLYAVVRDTIRTKKDIQEKINQNCIGILPKVTFKKYNKEVDRSILIDNPLTGDSFMETVRQLRNSIVSELDEMSKTILFTSASPEEGKTTVSTNLAIALAKMEKSVVLVDADIRNPSVEESTKKYEKYEKNRLDSYSQIECVPDLGIDIMTFTVSEDDMWKVINTDYLKELMNSLKQEYDYIIVDAPPCALVSDPITIASVVDTTILVIKQDTVRTTRIKYAIDSLQSVNANILGCVLNSAASGIIGYGYYYGGYGYAYNRYGYKKYGYGYGYKYGYGKNRF